MKVYVVEYASLDTDYGIMAIFYTEEQAKKAIKEHKRLRRANGHSEELSYSISTYFVREEY